MISLIRGFVKLWKRGSGKDIAREDKNDKQKNNESDEIEDTEKNDVENDIETRQRNSENETRKEKGNEYTEDVVSDRTDIINSGINFENETERTCENVICTRDNESKEIPVVSFRAAFIDDRSNDKRNESSDVSLNWMDRRFFSVSTVDKTSNKSDEILSLSDNVKCRFHRNFEKSCSPTCSTITHRTTSSTSFLPSELTPVQMSISTVEKSTSELYEYCLSDDDFDISHISALTNQSMINDYET